MQAGLKEKFFIYLLAAIASWSVLQFFQPLNANPLFTSKIKGMKKSIEFKRTQTRKKIHELKARENLEINT